MDGALFYRFLHKSASENPFDAAERSEKKGIVLMRILCAIARGLSATDNNYYSQQNEYMCFILCRVLTHFHHPIHTRTKNKTLHYHYIGQRTREIKTVRIRLYLIEN